MVVRIYGSEAWRRDQSQGRETIKRGRAHIEQRGGDAREDDQVGVYGVVELVAVLHEDGVALGDRFSGRRGSVRLRQVHVEVGWGERAEMNCMLSCVRGRSRTISTGARSGNAGAPHHDE